jgi:hypothetical protein
MSLDLGPALRAAIIAQTYPPLQPVATQVVEELSEWNGEPSVFTRRPVPADAADPMILINAPAAIGDEDGLTSSRPVPIIDLAIYGRKAEPGSPEDQTRAVERAAFALRELFHRQKFSVQPAGYSVTEIVAAGPFPAPVDDEVTVGRIVTLTIRLRRNL